MEMKPTDDGPDDDSDVDKLFISCVHEYDQKVAGCWETLALWVFEENDQALQKLLCFLGETAGSNRLSISLIGQLAQVGLMQICMQSHRDSKNVE